ncbi:MAG: hypothetical protein ACLGJD_23630 [Gammaproteobacteria bacterium]|uniref:hypothetical protein n=1 Tax=Pseudacidovorax sp. TaxID=1934311 RepID=UPI001B7B3B43|nr:hypothetical protein [Pseudacidovorax sp.]MBP6894860.1 hypothetical protein [Pseudacidovorax sp.]
MAGFIGFDALAGVGYGLKKTPLLQRRPPVSALAAVASMTGEWDIRCMECNTWKAVAR